MPQTHNVPAVLDPEDALPTVFDGAIDWSRRLPGSPGADCAIGADNDLDAVATWVRAYKESAHTMASYRREAWRLLKWCAEIAGKSLSSLNAEDFLEYLDFLRNPPAEWCGPPRPMGHAEWRPMTGPLSPISVRQSFTVLHGLFGFLEDAGYLSVNPTPLVARSLKVGRSAKRKSRRKPIPPDTLALLQGWLQTLGDDFISHRLRAEVSVFLHVAARLSELAALRWADVWSANGRWYLSIEGKGGKQRDAAVPPEALQALFAWRAYLAYPPLPLGGRGEDSPVFRRAFGTSNAPLTARGLAKSLKSAFMRADVATGAGGALASLHAHLFRHTAATGWLVGGADLASVAAQLGHSDVSTTSVYLNPDKKTYHDAIVRADEPGQAPQPR